MKKLLLGALALLGLATQAVAAPFTEGQAYKLKHYMSDLYFNMEIDGLGDGQGRHCASLQAAENASIVYFVQNPDDETQWQIHLNSADGPNLSSNSLWNSIINSADGYYWTVTEHETGRVTFERTTNAKADCEENFLGPNYSSTGYSAGDCLWSNQDGADANKLSAAMFEVVEYNVTRYPVTLTIPYGDGQSIVIDFGLYEEGTAYTKPIYDSSVLTISGWNDGDAITAAVNLTGTLAEGVKPFKLNSLRYQGKWATTDTAGLLIPDGSYDSAEYFFEVPVTDSENFKIYSLNQAKWLGAIANNTAKATFADTAGEFQLIKHTSGAEAIGNAGAASTNQVFFNYRNPGIGSWSVGNDAGSHWFMVYDNTNYQANLTAMGIQIGGAYGNIEGSTYATSVASAQAKYDAVADVADDVAEGFGELKAALKNALDATVAARAGQNVDIAALLAALDAANAAVNPNIAVYGQGQNIINNGNAFAALGVASEEGVAAWEAAVATAEAIDPTTFSEDDVTTITEAYTALVATSANTPGGAYVTIAPHMVPTDLLCVRYENGPYVGFYGTTENANKTTWQIVAAEGGFTLYNAYAAKYFKIAVDYNISNNATLVDSSDEASIFIFDIYSAATAQYGIKCVTETSEPYLNTNANNHMIHRWTAEANSSWYLSVSNAETAEAEAAIGSADDLADALTFCVVAESDKGTDPGYYTVSDEYTATYEASQGATEGSAEDQRAAAVALRAAFVNGVTLNVPEAGKFYRFQNKTSSKFITSIVNTNNDLTLVADGVNPVETIFYYDGTYVVSLADGKVLGNYNSNESELSWKTVLKDATNSGEITFPVSNVARTFYIQTELDRRLYGACNPNGRGDAVDAADTKGTGADYSWVITEVKELPFNATEQEIIAIYSPVALNLQDGVTAYTATVNNDLVPTTEIEGNVIPANTPVLLMFGEDVNADENGLVYLPIAAEEAAVVLAEEAAASPFTGSIYAKAAADATSYFTAQTHETYDENGATVETVDFLALAATEVVPGFASYIEIATESVPESVTAEGGHYDITGEDFVTGIEEIEAGANNAQTVIYDLQGRRLSAPVKGINIINGKKVLVK